MPTWKKHEFPIFLNRNHALKLPLYLFMYFCSFLRFLKFGPFLTKIPHFTKINLNVSYDKNKRRSPQHKNKAVLLLLQKLAFFFCLRKNEYKVKLSTVSGLYTKCQDSNLRKKMEQLQNKRFQLEFAKARNLQTLIILHRSRHFLADFCFIANFIDILVNINIYKIELLLFLFLRVGPLLNVTEKKNNMCKDARCAILSFLNGLDRLLYRSNKNKGLC